jgi:hypothetical protein
MSRFYTTADAIAAHLAAIPALDGVPFVVDRQKDIASELRKAVAKQSGCLAVISWTGSLNNDATADGPALSNSYTVTLFSKPVLRAGETPADDLIEAMAEALHDHRISPNDHFADRLVITGIDPIPADELLIYQIKISIPLQFQS